MVLLDCLCLVTPEDGSISSAQDFKVSSAVEAGLGLGGDRKMRTAEANSQ